MHGTVAILTGRGPACDPLQVWLDQLPRTVKIDRIGGNQIAYQRNEAVRHREGDWLLFVDNDCIPSFNALTQLLTVNVPVISGTVLERQVPFEVCATKNVEPHERWKVEDLPQQPFPVPAVGTGFLLIRDQVFRRMSDPWFRCGKVHPEVIAEDFDFCLRAAELGFPIYLDPRVHIGHLTSVIVWPHWHGMQLQWPTATGWERHRTPFREPSEVEVG